MQLLSIVPTHSQLYLLGRRLRSISAAGAGKLLRVPVHVRVRIWRLVGLLRLLRARHGITIWVMLPQRWRCRGQHLLRHADPDSDVRFRRLSLMDRRWLEQLRRIMRSRNASTDRHLLGQHAQYTRRRIADLPRDGSHQLAQLRSAALLWMEHRLVGCMSAHVRRRLADSCHHLHGPHDEHSRLIRILWCCARYDTYLRARIALLLLLADQPVVRLQPDRLRMGRPDQIDLVSRPHDGKHRNRLRLMWHCSDHESVVQGRRLLPLVDWIVGRLQCHLRRRHSVSRDHLHGHHHQRRHRSERIVWNSTGDCANVHYCAALLRMGDGSMESDRHLVRARHTDTNRLLLRFDERRHCRRQQLQFAARFRLEASDDSVEFQQPLFPLGHRLLGCVRCLLRRQHTDAHRGML